MVIVRQSSAQGAIPSPGCADYCCASELGAQTMNFDKQLAAYQELALSDPLLTQAQVSGLLGASISTLYRLRRAGTGPAWIKIGGAIKYRHSAVLEYLDAAEAITR
jgi:predicted DNA-binding transcriptional regulator AlpA